VTDEDDRWAGGRAEEVGRLFETLASHAPDSVEHREARDRIVEIQLPLVRYLARRFAGRTAPFEDLVQVGALGLIKAIERFDPTLGHEFSAYAGPTIVGEIKRHLRDTGWLLRVPRRAKELHAAVARAREDLTHELGRFPSISEIAARVDASPDEVAETLDVVSAREGVPLDPLVDPAEGGGAQRLVAQEETGFGDAELRAVLQDALDLLSEQERRVVMLRFVGGHTQSEIAARIGVSQMQVSRLLSRSLARMREALDD